MEKTILEFLLKVRDGPFDLSFLGPEHTDDVRVCHPVVLPQANLITYDAGWCS
jgi:hypothetical protein